MSEVPLHDIGRSRILPLPAEKLLNAALSRGPGYEPTPIGQAFQTRSVSGYFIDFRSKTASAAASDTDRLLSIAVAQLALGLWEHSLAGEADAINEFLRVCDVLEARAEVMGDELRWPARVAVPKYRLKPPWYSALVQSQAASVFVRAHLATGETRYARLAQRSIEPLLSPRSTDLVTQTAAGPILEEAPSAPSSHILNGWITGLWGLWDVHVGLNNPEAGRVFHASVDCLRMHLHAYDTGWWSRYSLYPHTLDDLAKPIYHRYHIAQLRVLYRLTGHAEFREVAERWRSYDRLSLCGLAVAQKAAFAATDWRRRQRWQLSLETKSSG